MKSGRGRLALLAVSLALLLVLMPSAGSDQVAPEPKIAILRQNDTNGDDLEYQPEIIGGETVQSDAFPWIAAIVSARYHNAYHGLLCAGTLIYPDWIMTAAHCVWDAGKTLRPEEVKIVLNQTDLLSDSGQRIAARDITVHPDFNPIIGDHDIALIQLARAVDIQPVTLLGDNPQAIALEGAESLLIGWGTTTWTIGQIGTYPTKLQQVEIPLVDRQKCQHSYRQHSGREVFITENMLCAGTTDNKRDACIGDSGGPLLFWNEETRDWKQLGIVSWGFGCAVPGFYGVYTNIIRFHPWIQEVTEDSDNLVGVPLTPVSSEPTPVPSATPAPDSKIRLPYVPLTRHQ